MLGRLVHKADFERLLAARSKSRSAHFALHHVKAGPSDPPKPKKRLAPEKLSTEPAQDVQPAVDDLPQAVWYGCVVPKRHAKRAVTRNLLKRQIREAFRRHASALPNGLWMVRLIAGFVPAQFVSARSQALADLAQAEIDKLLLGMAKPS